MMISSMAEMMRVISESFFEEGPRKRWWAGAYRLDNKEKKENKTMDPLYIHLQSWLLALTGEKLTSPLDYR